MGWMKPAEESVPLGGSHLGARDELKHENTRDVARL